MPAPVPAWRRVVDGVERRVAGPLEGAVQHDAFGVTVSIAHRAVHAVRSRTERGSRRLLHLLNVPAASDVNRLLTHIAAVERELRELRGAVDAGAAAPRTPRRPRAVTTSASE